MSFLQFKEIIEECRKKLTKNKKCDKIDVRRKKIQEDSK